MQNQLQVADLLALIKQNPQLAELLTTHYLKQQPMMLAQNNLIQPLGMERQGLNKDGSYGPQPGMMTPPEPVAPVAKSSRNKQAAAEADQRERERRSREYFNSRKSENLPPNPTWEEQARPTLPF